MKIFEKARWLSLDITVGAVVLLFFICSIHGVNTSWHIYLALAIAIWSIYTLDHLNDARKVPKLSNGRHAYHQTHFRQIGIVLLLVLLGGVINIFFLPFVVIITGLVLTLLAVLYLLLQQWLAISGLKEIVIATGYTAGVFLYPFLALDYSHMLILQAIQLLFIALANIVIVAWYDRKFDVEAGFASIAAKKEGTSKVMIVVLLLLSVISVIFYSVVFGLDAFQAFVLGSVIVLTLVYSQPSFFAIQDRFRLWADAVFFIPLLILPFL